MKTKSFDADVIVVGGGLAGLTLTALLGRQGIQALCIDRDDPDKTLKAAYDGRTTAISYGSRQVVEATGVWPALEKDACPIKDIHILDSGSPVLLDFLVDDIDTEAFGWITENLTLRQALLAQVKTLENASKARHLAPARVDDFSTHDDHIAVHLADGTIMRAPLVVGADGRHSFTREKMGIGVREWSYRQRAVVCTVTHENPHKNIAIEHFRPEGPFAVLPMTDDRDGRHRSSVVWTEHGPETKSSLHYSEDVFNAALNARFPAWYGQIENISQRFSYPLGLVHAHDYIAPRMALVADAAHGIHPIAGQGLNLGFRDIAALAELLVQARNDGKDLGAVSLLEDYQHARRLDNMAMAGATDTLNRLFSNRIGPMRLARQIGLKAVQKIGPARRFFMRHAMGTGDNLSKFIKGDKI